MKNIETHLTAGILSRMSNRMQKLPKILENCYSFEVNTWYVRQGREWLDGHTYICMK